MPNPYFRFKQFTVWHDQCAMKVNTDGVLLGAWVKVEEPELILDIGTGSGLIALMLAQRSSAMVHAVEIEENACKQARYNSSISPWPQRVEIIQADFCHYSKSGPHKYNLIVSNPPYFSNSLKNPNPLRRLARHNESLPLSMFLEGVSRVLSDNGIFAVILPDNTTEFESEAFINGLKCSRRMMVRSLPGGKIIRKLLEFRKIEYLPPVISEELVIYQQIGNYSDSYLELTQEFYL